MAKGKDKFNSLGKYLRHYYVYYQKQIVLVYRDEEKSNWANRCLYLSPRYNPLVKYNHRTLLDDEIVIEYDNKDPSLNERLSRRVTKKLARDGIKYAKWDTTNKSKHVHIITKNYNPSNRELFKKTIMRYYGTYYYDKLNDKIYDEDAPGRIKLFPDLGLAGSNHLIRAEFGLHEKTQDEKTLIYKDKEYPCRSRIPIDVFDEYSKLVERSVYTRIGQNTSELAEHDIVKNLMDTVKFQKGLNDGRERVIFALIHILKPKYKDNKQGLIDLLDEWYKYCSTQKRKMDKYDITAKVNYHWNRDYKITINTLKNIIAEVGGTI